MHRWPQDRLHSVRSTRNKIFALAVVHELIVEFYEVVLELERLAFELDKVLAGKKILGQRRQDEREEAGQVPDGVVEWRRRHEEEQRPDLISFSSIIARPQNTLQGAPNRSIVLGQGEMGFVPDDQLGKEGGF